jgi:purine-nucleoside phosphorylase
MTRVAAMAFLSRSERATGTPNLHPLIAMSPDYPQFIETAHRRRPRVALILGSGLGHLADWLEDICAVPFHAIPDMAEPTIPGHRGSLLLGEWAGQTVLIFSGRLHGYEGHPWRRVVRPVQIAHELGAHVLLVTNAAGGIRPDLNPGDLMAICDHIDLTRPGRWHDKGPLRSSPYAPRLIDQLRQAAARLGFTLPTGIYAQVTGPSYETPSEIRALRAIGADAVGMSTAREIQAAFDLGMECAAVSCITNKAAGLAAGPINHDEVLAIAASQRERLAGLIETFVADLCAESRG